jgi:OmpA-OmpF porin, OOP family
MKTSIIYLIAICFGLDTWAQSDNPQCTGKTFSFFITFDGFYIERCDESEFSSYKFELDGASRIVEKKGKLRQVWFRKKKDAQRVVSGLQIIQNHVNAIKAVGGSVVEGSKDGIYKTIFQGNELWIHLRVYGPKPDVDNFSIVSIESTPMVQEVSAVSIKGSMDGLGKIALYGILFDTGKADIKPESEKELKEVAAYLQGNPTVSVYIVGHTDSQGDAAVNIKLSKGRGEAVKQYLITKYKIDASRLSGDGVGQLCPVASNDTEPGRKLNRRVEIVKK